MTPEKEAFLKALQEKTFQRQHEKFTEGDESHKEDFSKVDHLQEAFDEAIDLLSYLYGAMENKEDQYKKGYAAGFKDAVQIDAESRLNKSEQLGLSEREE